MLLHLHGSNNYSLYLSTLMQNKITQFSLAYTISNERNSLNQTVHYSFLSDQASQSTVTGTKVQNTTKLKIACMFYCTHTGLSIHISQTETSKQHTCFSIVSLDRKLQKKRANPCSAKMIFYEPALFSTRLAFCKKKPTKDSNNVICDEKITCI